MGARPVHVKAFGVFLLAFCAAAPLAWGRQNQSAPPDEPAASSQPAQQQDQQGSDATSGPPAQQEAQRAAAQSTPAVPATLTVPEGTMIPGRIGLSVSSDRNDTGETFTAAADQPLNVHG